MLLVSKGHFIFKSPVIKKNKVLCNFPLLQNSKKHKGGGERAYKNISLL